MALGIGIYGQNGHQLYHELEKHPHAELVAVAGIDREKLPSSLQNRAGIHHYSTLDELLGDPRVALVSLCSPRRAEQAHDAMKALAAGKHVYAEKPCAMSENELDALIVASRESGCMFREMAGTAFEEPYRTMRSLIGVGVIGTVVQVLAQKSYPYFAGRPQDEDVDGGLTLQVGVHAMRFIEHVAGVPVSQILAAETRVGNPAADGGLRMATSYLMQLQNGGVASVVANYLNPKGFGLWGNESLRVFGTMGMIEATDGGTRTRLIIGDKDHGPLALPPPGPSYFDMIVDQIVHRRPMPLTLEQELHPTRMLIRARETLRRAHADWPASTQEASTPGRRHFNKVRL